MRMTNHRTKPIAPLDEAVFLNSELKCTCQTGNDLLSEQLDRLAAGQKANRPCEESGDDSSQSHQLTPRELALLISALQCMPCAAMIQDLYGTVLVANTRIEAMFKVGHMEGIGRNANEFCPPDEMEEQTRVFERVRRGESVICERAVRLDHHGQEFLIGFRADPLRDEAGQVIGVIKALHRVD